MRGPRADVQRGMSLRHLETPVSRRLVFSASQGSFGKGTHGTTEHAYGFLGGVPGTPGEEDAGRCTSGGAFNWPEVGRPAGPKSNGAVSWISNVVPGRSKMVLPRVTSIKTRPPTPWEAAMGLAPPRPLASIMAS